MKKLLLTLLVALSLALCGSVVFAVDGENSEVISEISQATPQVFQEALAVEQETLDERMILATRWYGWGGYHHWWKKIFCHKYERKCCEASPIKWEKKWCKWKAHKAERFGCDVCN
jgi:hypothetical protein